MRTIATQQVSQCWCGRKLTGGDKVVTRDYSYRTCSNDFTYSKCECGSFVLVNRPVDGEIQNIYPNNYLAYSPSQSRLVSQIRKLNFGLKIRVVKKFLKSTSISKWLDYGAGAGELALSLKQIGVSEVIVVDAHPSAQLVLRQEGLVVVDPESNQLKVLKSVDVVSALQVIEHVPDPVKLLSDFYGMLRPGGILILETPSPTGLDFKIGKSGKWGGWHAPRHFHVFTKSALADLVKVAGFHPVATKNIPSPYLWSETLLAVIGGAGSRKLSGLVTIRNPLFIMLSICLEALLRLFRYKTSNQRIIAVRP